jgi:hypothetical protein
MRLGEVLASSALLLMTLRVAAPQPASSKHSARCPRVVFTCIPLHVRRFAASEGDALDRIVEVVLGEAGVDSSGGIAF